MRAIVRVASDDLVVAPTEVPVPSPDAGEVLVRVGAVGVGVHDPYFLPPGGPYPQVIGIEGAGVVEETGDGVTWPRPGDRVAFISAMQAKGGTWAEYAVVDAGSLLLTVPPDLDLVRAAALPVAGGTAVRALAAVGDLPAGASLFVGGGAGSIGTLLIQLARRRGWHVAASASTHNHDHLRFLGAATTVDYRNDEWPAEIRHAFPGGIDAAIAVHPGTTAETMGAVRDGGRLVTISGDSVCPERGVQVETVAGQGDVGEALASMLGEVAAGDLHLEIEHVYPFAEAPQALARVQTRHARGKVVLRLGTDGAATG